MDFTGKLFSKAVLGATVAFSIFIVGCGGGSSAQDCCQAPKLEAKIKQEDKVVPVPEIKGKEVIYVDRNVTVVEYRDRNITIIKYKDRNVTVDVIKVRPEANIEGLIDGAVLKGDTLAIDGINSSDSDGNVTSYKWMLDDVEISTLRNPTISLPNQEGSHKLCLVVTDNDNLISTETCKSFVIPHVNLTPTAAIAITPNPKSEKGKIKTKCPFTLSGAGSVVNDGNITAYAWTIDNNKTLQGADQTISFDTEGTHKVCLEVTASTGLKDENCQDVVVEKHSEPTAVLTVKENGTDKLMSKDTLFVRGERYNLSCAGSKDDCGNENNMTCSWKAHSYRIENGEKVDYKSDCIKYNNAPKTGTESWVNLCGSSIDRYRYVEIELTITDGFNNTKTRTDVFEVAP